MDIFKKYSAIATTTLLLGALAAPANADTGQHPQTPKQPDTAALAEVTAPITAPIAEIAFERPAVESVAAPKPVAKPVTQLASAPTAPVATKTPTNTPTTNTTQTPTQTTAPKAPQAPAAVPSSGKGAAILASAMGQLGVAQDCTALVSNSLASVGILFHGWPWQYAPLGTPVSVPQPGDILIYQNAGAGVAHVAIYAGNGQAVHGGFNGSTVLFSANVGTGYAAYRVA